ncbi:MAG: serine protease [Candidatus Aminicenantes bacterium]|nr:serine protease [Candidatus Aminicenantes bacterium]
MSSVPLAKGCSGGPLLNLEGNVIGVNSTTLGDEPRISFSVDIVTIKEFLSMPDNPVELAYAGSSVLLSVILQKLGGFWGPILRGIVSIPKGIGRFLFFHGVLRGIYIIILAGILISWKSPLLFRYLKAWRRRKAVNEIVKWSNGASYIEDESEIKSD